MGRSVVEYTTGAAGTGKTLIRCPRFLIKDFLPNRSGVHWSNFPLGLVPDDHIVPPRFEGETFKHRIAEHLARKVKGSEPEQWMSRIEVIPEDEIESWRKGTSGPWDFFADKNLGQAHIAVDEIHVFCGRSTKSDIRKKWQDWLGEIRHRGATVEFLSQSPNKVAQEISWESGLRRQLVSGEDRRDPLLGIPMAHYYELRAGLITGEYLVPTFVIEQRQMLGFFKRSHAEKVAIDPIWFQFYNSFSTPHGGGAAGQTEKKEFQKRGKLGLIWWFVRSHPWALTSRAMFFAAFLLLISGQGGIIFAWGIEKFIQMGMSQSPTVPTVEPVSVSPTSEAADTTQAPQRSTTTHAHAPGTPGEPAPRAIPPEVAARLQAYEAQTQQLEADRLAAQQRADVLKAKLDRASALVLLTKETAVFRGGYEYRVGERIDYGAFEGCVIQTLDYKRRSLTLDDGRTLRLGRPDDAELQREAPPADEPPVRGHVPATGGPSARSGRSG